MGLLLFFLPNFPGAMFIQGAMFIPDSRVHTYIHTYTDTTKSPLDHCLPALRYRNSSTYQLARVHDFLKLVMNGTSWEISQNLFGL